MSRKMGRKELKLFSEKDTIEKIRGFVGRVTAEDLRYVDCFITENIGLFMPAGGACFFALAPAHSHPAYMFVLPFNDQTCMKIDDKIITAMPGNISSVSPDIIHHELPSDIPPRYIAIFIKKKYFEKELKNYSISRDIIFKRESYEASPELLSLLKRFIIESDNAMLGSKVVLSALSVEICHSILRSILNFKVSFERISERIEINRVVEYLYSNLDQKITVRGMAKKACMSTSHFFRTFKNETGTSPMHYINEIRLERAKKPQKDLISKINDRKLKDTNCLCL